MRSSTSPCLVTAIAQSFPRTKAIISRFDYHTPSGCKDRVGKWDYDPNDLRAVIEYIEGVGCMKSMVTFFEQRRILNYQGPHLGSSYTASDGKRMYVKFRWDGDGDDLLTRIEDQ